MVCVIAQTAMMKFDGGKWILILLDERPLLGDPDSSSFLQLLLFTPLSQWLWPSDNRMSVIFENLVEPSNTFRNKQKCFLARQKRLKSDASINAIRTILVHFMWFWFTQWSSKQIINPLIQDASRSIPEQRQSDAFTRKWQVVAVFRILEGEEKKVAVKVLQRLLQ